MMNGIDLILADHRRVEALFAEFESTGDGAVVGQIVDSLSAHDQAEHAALYPLAGELIGDEAMLDHCLRAHSTVKKMIERLTTFEGPTLTVAVTALRDAVAEHVTEEESELLPALAKAATPGQLDGLAARIEQNKQRVG